MSEIRPFYFDRGQLIDLGRSHHEQYLNADPFPHIVIDNFLPPETLTPVLEEFSVERSGEWRNFQNAREVKLANNQDELMGPHIRHMLNQFNSGLACQFIEELTGIQGIIPDPYFWGGGQHQIEPGGFLKIHADFNKHPKLGLHRRINLLLYLNKDWDESYGGHLELWDLEMSRCVQRVLPIFNRCVIFTTTSTSWHGHPEPLSCPDGRARKSLALYYYTQDRPEEEIQGVHSTLFRERPGEDLTQKSRLSARAIARKLIPPIFLDGWRYLKR